MNKKYLIHLFENHKVLLFIQTLVCALLYGATSINDMNAKFLVENITGFGKTYILISAIFYAFFISVKYYQMRSVDVLDSLPSKKQSRKMSEVLFGWLIFVAPFIVCMIAGTVYTYAQGVNAQGIWEKFIMDSLMLLLTGTLYYLLCVFLLSLCTSLKEGIINIVLVLLIMYLFSIGTVSFLFGNFVNFQAFSYGSDNSIWNTTQIIFLEFLQPFGSYAIAMPSQEKEVYQIAFILIALLSLLLFILIYRFAKKRRAEDVGSHKKCLPLYFTGIALGSLFVLMASFNGPVSLASTFAPWVVSITVASMIAVLYDRKKKVIVWTILTVIISGACAYGFRYGVIMSEGFGTYRNYKTIPDTMDIEVTMHSYIERNNDRLLLVNNYTVKRGNLSKKQFYQVVEKLQDDMVDIRKNALLHFKSGDYEGDEYGVNIVYDSSKGPDSKGNHAESGNYSYSLKSGEFNEWSEYFEKIGCKIVMEEVDEK